MGNCLVLEEKVIKIVKPDGKVLEYRAPMKVYQVLSEFSGHVITETADHHQVVVQHLKPETKLLGGHFYYLFPLPLKQPQGTSHVIKKNKKKVRFSNPEVEDSIGQNSTICDNISTSTDNISSSTVMRIKLVISKKELKEMLKRGGVSVDDMVSKLHDNTEKNTIGSDNDRFNGTDHANCEEWKPMLESIVEVN